MINRVWDQVLSEYLAQSDFQRLLRKIKKIEDLTPQYSQIFQAFKLTDFDEVKVVILGQDPYHNPGQAMGLAFSVPSNCKVPPSLQNILKEVGANCGKSQITDGDLTIWAKQGVFLLNSMLTVSLHQPGSHSKLGWEDFTDFVIHKLSEQKSGLVFMLWGKFAQSKQRLIDSSKHLVLKSSHPSPLAAYRGFLGCEHFVKCNQYLDQKIIW